MTTTVILDTVPSTTAVGTIVSKARLILIDPDGVRWSDSELVGWLSDAERATVMAIPSASSVVYTSPLIAGTRQTIPLKGYMLLSLKRNIAANELSAGRAIRVVSQELMDAFNPDWHTATADPVVQNYMFDPQDSKSFLVFPPNDGTGKVEMIYSVYPAPKSLLTELIEVADIYQTALLNYILSRAYQKDGDFTTGMALANNYLQLFTMALGATEQGSLGNNPNLGQGNFNPAAKGSAK